MKKDLLLTVLFLSLIYLPSDLKLFPSNLTKNRITQKHPIAYNIHIFIYHSNIYINRVYSTQDNISK